MALDHHHSAEFQQLLDALCDRDISVTEFDRLQDIVSDDDDACRHYLSYVQMHGTLGVKVFPEPTTLSMVGPFASDPRQAVTKPDFDDITPLIVSQSDGNGRSATAKFLHNMGWNRKYRGVPGIVGATVMMVLIGYFGVLMGLLAWDRAHRGDRRTDDGLARTQSSGAILANVDGCRWKGPAPADKDGRLANRTLQLRQGRAELKFDQGATVTIEGPAEWFVDGANGATLHSGKLIAKVPPQAVGFTVRTPTAKIVDLGTEFGVEVDAHKQTDVYVIKGKVGLFTDARADESLRDQQPIILTTGMARRIELAQAGAPLVVKDLPIAPEHFSRLSRTELARPLTVGAAICSSSSYPLGRRSVNRLIDGSGMNGERHTNLADGAMWNSSLGKTEGEFVLFDLSTPCRLEAMKVWNYNEAERDCFRFRGIAKADIFISARGNGDPLSRPDDWKLAVKDQVFKAADGTETYATPDKVPLGGVEARYVAIVIKKVYGVDPSYPDPKMQSGGLSEVQFYGERVLSKK